MAVYEFEGNKPEIGEGTYVHPEAVLIGQVEIGRGCFIGAGAVLRGDFGRIIIGNGSNVQENAVMHAGPFNPVIIEDDVTFAHGALIHDSTVRRGAFIGMGAIILHGATVEEHAFVAAVAVVSPGYVVPSRTIVQGNPARFYKNVSDAMFEANKLGVAVYQELTSRCIKGLKKIS